MILSYMYDDCMDLYLFSFTFYAYEFLLLNCISLSVSICFYYCFTCQRCVAALGLPHTLASDDYFLCDS